MEGEVALRTNLSKAVECSAGCQAAHTFETLEPWIQVGEWRLKHVQGQGRMARGTCTSRKSSGTVGGFQASDSSIEAQQLVSNSRDQALHG